MSGSLRITYGTRLVLLISGCRKLRLCGTTSRIKYEAIALVEDARPMVGQAVDGSLVDTRSKVRPMPIAL